MLHYDNEEDLERAELYTLFAGFFMKEPTVGMLMQVSEIFQMKFNDSIFEIGMDFVNNFVKSEGNLLPFESLYNYPIGDKPRPWGKAAEDVQAFYTKTGLVIDEEINLIQDHISVELLFMSYLIENDFIEQQKRFLEEHLRKWIPEYCNKIYKHAKTVFYKELANLLKEFILSEYENFEPKET